MVHLSDAMTTPAGWRLEAERLAVRHRRLDVVQDFDWSHVPGRIAWLVGENGAGKSSLLRVLAGRSRPASGSVRRHGPLGATAAVLYYRPGMQLPARARVKDWARLTDRLLRSAGPAPHGTGSLAPRLDPERRLDRLSTGEAKRLLLDALLRRQTPFVFLDEPYEHLSPRAKETLTTILAARAAHAVVVVATNQELPGRASGPVIRLDGARAAVEPYAEVSS